MPKSNTLPAAMLLLGVALLASGCASRGEAPSGQAIALDELPPEQARIVVYRKSGPFGLNAIRPTLYLNEQSLGPAFPCAYRVIDTAPGEYKVSIGGPHHREVTVAVSAGETVYVQALISTGADLLQGTVQTESVATAAVLVPTLNRVAL